MHTRACRLCHNQRPVEDFLLPSGAGGENKYNHPNCSLCRAMLESFGIEQKAPW